MYVTSVSICLFPHLDKIHKLVTAKVFWPFLLQSILCLLYTLPAHKLVSKFLERSGVVVVLVVSLLLTLFYYS